VPGLFSRKVVGWAMAGRMAASLVCDALTMALWRRKLPEGAIVHSGRGASIVPPPAKPCPPGTSWRAA